MKFLAVDFVFDETDSPGCHIWKSEQSNTIYISFYGEEGRYGPRASFFLHSEQDLINFKNKVQWAYEDFVRRETKDD